MKLRTLTLPLAAAALFGAAPAFAQNAADPALLAKAEVAAAALLPAGSMEKIMGPMFEQISKQVSGSMMDIPMSAIARMGGISEEEAAGLGEATLKELMAIIDPAFDQRMGLMMQVMGREMGPLMTQFEPDMRAGMARAFAGKYTGAELDEINAFFASPTGARFGAGFMALAADPEYLKSMETMMPKLMEAMPTIMGRAMEEMGKLPPPKKADDLTKAEKDKIAKLIGKAG
jgi:hypothetical protein